MNVAHETPSGARHLPAALGDLASVLGLTPALRSSPRPKPRCPDAQIPRGVMAAISPQALISFLASVKVPSGMAAAVGRKGIFLPLLPSCPEACAWFGGPGGCGEAWGPEGPLLLRDLGFSREEGPWGGGLRPKGLRSLVGLGRRQANPSPDQRPLSQHSPQNAAKEATAFLLLPGPKCSFRPQCFIFFMCYQF